MKYYALFDIKVKRNILITFLSLHDVYMIFIIKWNIKCNNIQGGTGTRHGGISIDIVKWLNGQAFEPLVNIMNTGMTPNSFKTSVITPTYKKENPNKVENYRSIDLDS